MALRFIIIISATRLKDVMAPIKNIALKAVVFGTAVITPSEVSTSAVYRVKNEEYARNAIERHKNRIKFDAASGGLDYAIVRYKNVIRGMCQSIKNFTC